MKKLLCLTLLLFSIYLNAQVKIGSNPTILNAASLLELESNSKGFLPPRMTNVQKMAITSPPAGLIVWCTDCGFYGGTRVFNGVIWTNMLGDIEPNSPTSPIATIGNTQARISFTAPLPNGGSAITSYTVTSSSGLTAIGVTSPIIFAGLTPGTSYTFTVIATNAAGNSVASVATSAVLTAVASGNASCNSNSFTDIVEIISITGKTWMDRNLGASRVGTTATDYMAYGCLFQWGRGNDGHASISWTSSTVGTAVNGSTTTPATSDVPGDALFIKTASPPDDWRNPQSVTLWQTTGATNNNPCPLGFHVPTNLQITNELTANGITNGATAFSSPLKIVKAGYRYFYDGSIQNEGLYSYFWSSVVSGVNAFAEYIDTTSILSNPFQKGFGHSVRCIKD
jgi:uncharacterized protein (TIGR02145 family)